MKGVERDEERKDRTLREGQRLIDRDRLREKRKEKGCREENVTWNR